GTPTPDARRERQRPAGSARPGASRARPREGAVPTPRTRAPRAGIAAPAQDETPTPTHATGGKNRSLPARDPQPAPGVWTVTHAVRR
ncbi:hypothetical protein AAHH78_35050, partial [Burkholderia pseudomallei]